MEGRVQSCCLILSVLVHMGIMGNAVKVLKTMSVQITDFTSTEIISAYWHQTSFVSNASFHRRKVALLTPRVLGVWQRK